MKSLLQCRSLRQLLCASLSLAGVAAAAQTLEVESADLLRLKDVRALQSRVSIAALPFPDGAVRALELKPVQLWAPDVRITVNDGRETRPARVALPRCWRGGVRESPESAAAVCVTSAGAIVGNVIDRRQLFHLQTAGDRIVVSSDNGGGGPAEQGWHCQTNAGPGDVISPRLPKPQALPTFTATYVLGLAIETDYELYHAAGDDPQALTDYLGSLINAVAAIYDRDLQTTVQINAIHYYSSKSGNYPWTAEPVVVGDGIDNRPALDQVADYYHGANGETAPPYANDPRSVVLYLSARNWGGGLAWPARACTADEYDPASGHWMGAYAFCSQIVFGSVPDPQNTINGVPYAVPRSNYFSLYGTAHEIGHTAGSPHTHCIALTADEKTKYNVTRSWVDTCYAKGGDGCYSDGPDTAPPELGTLMSYCHLIRSDWGFGDPQTRFTFGQFGEPSEKVINDYIAPRLAQVAPPLSSSITAPAFVGAGSTGNTASIVDLGSGFTYAWSIDGGTIAAGQGTHAVTFSAGNNTPLVLRVTVTNALGCGVTDYVSIATSGPPATIWSQQPVHTVTQSFANGRPALDFVNPTAATLPAGRYKPFYIGLPRASQSACVMRYLTVEWYPNAQRNAAERLGFATMDGVGGTWETAPDGGNGIILTILQNQQDGSDPLIGPNDYFRFAAGDCGDASRSIAFGFDEQSNLSYFIGSRRGDIVALLGAMPTLSASVSAAPRTGAAPLVSTITAFVNGGTAEGLINYSFWWDCADPGTSVDAVSAVCGDPTNALHGAKFNGVTLTSKSVSHTYDTGTYTPKVILERGTASPVTAATSISVARAASPGNLVIAAQGTTSPGDYRYLGEPSYQAFRATMNGSPTKLTVRYSGFFNNPYNPAFRATIYDTADYAAVGTAPVVASGSTGPLCIGCNAFQDVDVPLTPNSRMALGHTYVLALERTGFGDFALHGTTDDLLGFASCCSGFRPKNLYFVLEGVDSTLTSNLDAAPASGPTPLNPTLTATIGGTATGTANYTFWWNCADAGTSVDAVTAICGDPTNPLYGAKFDGVSATTKSVSHSYTSGNYTAKVIVERGTASPSTAATPVSVARAPSPGGIMIAAQPAIAPNDGRYFGDPVAQAFTATNSGTPVKITIQYSGFFNNPFNPVLQATIYDTANYADVGTAPVVASGNTGVLCLGCNNYQEVDASFGSATRMTAGHTYLVVFQRTGLGDFVLNGTTANPLGFTASRAPTNVYFLLEGVDQTLTGTLAAAPSSGPAPLSTTLTATAAGSATGTVNYTFWWNCADAGTSVGAVTTACGDPTNAAIGAKFDAVAAASKQTAHTYASAGTYTAKVIVERGTAPPAEQRATITVAPPTTLTARGWANPAVGTAAMTTSLSASVTGGDAIGTVNYTFWWNCADAGTSVQNVAAVCGDPTNAAIGATFTGVAALTQHVAHTYGAGNVTAKVIVERGGAPPVAQSIPIAVATAPPGATVLLHQTAPGLGCGGSISGPITNQELDWGTISPGTTGWVTQLRYGSGWTAIGNVGLKIVDDVTHQTVFSTATGPDTTDDSEFGIAFNPPTAFQVIAGRPYHVYAEYGATEGRDSHQSCGQGDRDETKMQWLGTLDLVCPTIVVSNPSNAVATVNQPFSATFTQSGIAGTASFSVASGTLPGGLSLSASGVLSGTPSQSGDFPIATQATAANGCAGTGAVYPLHVCPVIAVTNPATTTATLGTPLSLAFGQTGANSPSFATGSRLPAGLSLSAAGVLSGTPTELGSFPIRVTVTDAAGCSGANSAYTLIVTCGAISVGPTSLPNPILGVVYSASFTATGATGAVVWSLQGTLPTGMSFSAGTLSGTPSQCGTFPISVIATEADGCSGSQSYSLSVACPALTVMFAGDGHGTVTSNPAGLSCTANCSGNFNPGVSVALAAQSAAGSTFAGWSGDCSGLSCQVAMTGNRTVTATFTTHGYYVVAPCRVVDTRGPAGPYGGPALNPGIPGIRNIVMAGRCGIPSGATAVAINLIAISPTAVGWLTAYPGPSGTPVPYASTLNYAPGKTRANNAITPLGNDGTMNLFNSGPNPIHFVIDVNGYFK